jgi:ribosomal protein S18 acetylase RimI-like enzyme
MTISEAKLNDIPNLVWLFDAYRVFYQKPSDKIMATTFLTERLEKQESVIFVAENQIQELVGFVQLYPLFSSTKMKKLWLLNDLYVAENQRGKGISIALIDACKQHCITTEACGLLLETAKTNIIGNNLYPKTGFELDENHNYYSWDC